METANLGVEYLPLADIRENPLNKEVFNDLDREKYEALKDYIKKSGLLKPLIVNKDNILLSGHARYRICKELGYEKVPVQRAPFSDPKAEDEFLIKDNLLTRTLSAIEIGKAGIHLEHLAKKYQRTGKPLRDIVAKTLGISSFQYVKMKAILAWGDPEMIARVDRGELSVAKAYAILHNERQRNELRKMALGEKPRFRLIHEDPLSVLQNFREGSCDTIIAEPPKDVNPVWIDLSHRALKETGSFFVFIQKDFSSVGTVQDIGFFLMAPICILGRSHLEGRFVWNHRLLLWFVKTTKCRINEPQISTVWDFRMSQDVALDTYARIIHLTTGPADLVIHLFGDNRPMTGLNERLQRNIFAVQPDKDAWMREKLNV